MNERVFWYGLDGKPIDDRAADQLLRDIGKRRVAYTLVSRRPPIEVSTVFLVLDHGMFSEVELWETMVFGGAMNMLTARYATRSQARVGHVVVVARLRDGIAAAAADRRRVSRMHASYRARWA